ncbi:MAG: UDP-N-acetylmuramoyl-L-alanine--D-glutamate ligase, partial [Bifidobacteriaceae bacterium]|jgi:UDP-N-acetylmuramoylalanine--D-glutamate ligase|nr:UDP-N-acetylmuramoyl-L-alanine--D-glutamate ligase [Bifidobacteriaceae bacterium]
VSEDLRGARVAVLGLGASGRAALHALRQAGAHAIAVDDAVPSDIADPSPIPSSALDVSEIDLVVASPGWPPSRRPLPQAATRVPIWSEVELAWRLRVRPDAPWLCLTGTNGKTTTVELTAEILKAANWDAVAAGNIGRPLVEVATDPTYGAFACELSSFQLHFTHSLAPVGAALLNLAPDHLDWHQSFEAYAMAKARIANGARRAVIVGEEPGLSEVLARGSKPDPLARWVRFTLGEPGPGEIGVRDGAILDRANSLGRGVELAGLEDLAHLAVAGASGPPDHLVLDALGAIALARAVNTEPAAIRQALRGFAPAEHRLAPVATVEGVAYIDDSKATNPHAVEAAFAAIPGEDVVWIAGGLAKGTAMDGLMAAIVHRLRAVVLIGTDRSPFVEALQRHASSLPLVQIDAGETDGVMKQAVGAAHALAGGSGTVLLAPAAASQDQFANYAVRGEAFAAAVRQLAAGDRWVSA